MESLGIYFVVGGIKGPNFFKNNNGTLMVGMVTYFKV